MFSIIIPSFHGKNLLSNNLSSVLDAANNSNHPFEIILVDDGYDYSTHQFILSSNYSIRYIYSISNTGFSRACNFGARLSHGDILIFLNNDMFIDINCFKSLPDIFHSYNRLFGVRFAIRNTQLEPFTDSSTLSFIPNIYRGFISVNILSNNHPADQSFPLIFSLSGGACAINRSLFFECGGFDTIYSPFYWEDTDLSLSAWLDGYHIRYAFNSFVYHTPHSTINNINQRYVSYVSKRNRYIFIWKHCNEWYVFITHIFWMISRLLFSIPFQLFNNIFSLILTLKLIHKLFIYRRGKGKYRYFSQSFLSYLNNIYSNL